MAVLLLNIRFKIFRKEFYVTKKIRLSIVVVQGKLVFIDSDIGCDYVLKICDLCLSFLWCIIIQFEWIQKSALRLLFFSFFFFFDNLSL